MDARFLQAKKIVKNNGYAGIEVGRENIVKFTKEWCTADDLDGVLLDDVFEAFYKHCEEKGFPKINRSLMGRIFSQEIGVIRKKVRYQGKLVYIYSKRNI